MKFSDNQKRAIKQIESISAQFGKDRWFIQEEVVGAGHKTLIALVNKGYLTVKNYADICYYQIISDAPV